MIPILHFPGEIMPGQFGPIRRVDFPRKNSHARAMSMAGMPSVMHTTRATPASAASIIASAANGGGTKITDALAAVAFTASRTGLNNGRARCGGPPFPRCYAAHNVGAVGDSLLRVKGALLSSETLNN